MPDNIVLSLPESLVRAVKREARRARIRPETLVIRAVRQYLEDIEDIRATKAALKGMKGKRGIPLEKLKKELGLDD